MSDDKIENEDMTNIEQDTNDTNFDPLSYCPEPTARMRETASPLYRIPVFLSHPSRLNMVQQEFIDAIIFQITKALLLPRTLPESEQYPETPLTNIRRMILSSYGLVALNLRQRQVELLQNNLNQSLTGIAWEGSPFAQIEPAMAYLYGLPILLIRETGVEQNGLWSFGIAPLLILEWDSTAADPIETFFTRNDWKSIFQSWVAHARSGFYIQTQPEFKYSCSEFTDS